LALEVETRESRESSRHRLMLLEQGQSAIRADIDAWQLALTVSDRSGRWGIRVALVTAAGALLALIAERLDDLLLWITDGGIP
jgi:hypothetical protein